MSETTATAPPPTDGGAPLQSPAPVSAPVQTSGEGTQPQAQTEPALKGSVLSEAGAAPPADPAKPAEAPAITPTTFADFTLPEGYGKDDPLVSTFVGEASKLGLSQDAAQAIISKVGEQLTAQQKAVTDNWLAVNAEWQDKIKADADYGGSKLPATLANVGRLFDDFVGAANTPERQALNQALLMTGAGNNPAVFRLLANVANALTEGRHVAGAPSRGSFDAATMFPKSVPAG